MSHFIYSTHTNPVTYVEYDTESSKNHNIIKRRFTVAGGHGLCNTHFVTPQGVVTRVDRDEDFEWLTSLPAFQKDIKNGFIRIQKRKEDSEKVVKRDMNLKDGSAPKTPDDFTASEGQTHTYRTNSASQML
jgi:hypothetical protein